MISSLKRENIFVSRFSADKKVFQQKNEKFLVKRTWIVNIYDECGARDEKARSSIWCKRNCSCREHRRVEEIFIQKTQLLRQEKMRQLQLAGSLCCVTSGNWQVSLWWTSLSLLENNSTATHGILWFIPGKTIFLCGLEWKNLPQLRKRETSQAEARTKIH